jgi:hypothetical protein
LKGFLHYLWHIFGGAELAISNTGRAAIPNPEIDNLDLGLNPFSDSKLTRSINAWFAKQGFLGLSY